MRDIKVTGIRTYPIKSASGLLLNESEVHLRGLQYDRRWALFDANHVVMTARDYPALLRLTPEISSNGLAVKLSGATVLNIPFTPIGKETIELTVWEDTAKGVEISEATSEWFTEYLRHPCKLIHMDANCDRDVGPGSGGSTGDVVSYADECPLLLISEGSLADLNDRLEAPVTMTNFRPNIVIEGCKPFTEDDWTGITIGDCEFRVSQQCQRCVFTTIDPITRERHPQQEPLRTLSTYRRHPDGGVAFGVHLIPQGLGSIRVGDEIVVSS